MTFIFTLVYNIKLLCLWLFIYSTSKQYQIIWITLYVNDNFKFWTSFLSPIPRRKMKLSTNFAAMLSLVGGIKSFLDCNPSLELRDITHVQYIYTHSLTGNFKDGSAFITKLWTCSHYFLDHPRRNLANNHVGVTMFKCPL